MKNTVKFSLLNTRLQGMSTRPPREAPHVSSAPVRRAWLPLLLLLGYGCSFAWRTLAGGLLVFDDHPGQMYRVAHVLTVGFAPWRLNPGWWAGYAELQFYPPGASYIGAAIHYASFI